MKVSLIRNKNRILTEEIAFLENQYSKGWELKGRNHFFYTFGHVEGEGRQASYEIDLLPNSFSVEELQVSGWEVAAVVPANFKRLQKVYYLREGNDDRLLIDDDLRNRYYKAKYRQMSMLFFLLFSPLLLMLLPIPIYIPQGLVPYLFLSITASFFTLPLVIRYEKALSKEWAEKVAAGEALPIRYSIRFANLTDTQMMGLQNQLAGIGKVKKVSEAYFYLTVPLPKEALMEEIQGYTGISEENINLMHPADLWFVTKIG